MESSFQPKPDAAETDCGRTSARPCASRLGAACLSLACLTSPAALATQSALPAGIPPENLPMPSTEETTETLQASLSIGYESLFIASGMQSAYGSLQSNAELAYYGFTAGVWANNPLDSQDTNPAGPFGPEYRFYGNYEASLTEQLWASIGFTYYMHPRKGSTPNRHREINLGIGADVLLEPELVYNYDFDLQQHDLAIAISHEESLDQWLPVEGFSVAAGIVFGYLHADRPESNQAPNPQESRGYIYTEIAADIIYTHKDILSLYAGPRFASNDSDHGNIADRRSNFWWGMGCKIEF